MIKIYLITGFLGAGKTTMLKNLIAEWKNKKLAVIINEFGKEGIDGKVVSETGVLTEEINNGSIFCSCKLDRFLEVLQSVVQKQPEIIVVEASGLADPTQVRKILEEVRFKEEIEFQGSICLVDSKYFNKVINTAKVSSKQVKVSDIALINKIDLISEYELKQIEDTLKQLNPYLKVYHTLYGKVELEWIESLKIQYSLKRRKEILTKDIGLQKFLVTIGDEITYREFIKFLEMFIEDTYRIKGLIELEGKNYLVDCVGIDIEISLYEGMVKKEKQLVVLAGEKMPLYKSLKKASEWYCQYDIKIQA